MTCEQVGRELQTFVDDEIADPQLQTALEEHFAHCPTCKKQLVARRKLESLLRMYFRAKNNSKPVQFA